MYDLVVSGGSIVLEHGTTSADLAVEGGVVRAVSPRIDDPSLRRIDATGLTILPGLIDPHVHLSLPMKGTVSCDDVESGTIAALFGGVTTVGDFTVPERGQSLPDALAERRRRFQGRARTDYWLHLNVTWFADGFERKLPAQLDQIAAEGARSLKIFTCYSRDGIAISRRHLLTLLAEAHKRDLLVLVHAEDDAGMLARTDRLVAAGKTGPRDYPDSRPPQVEAAAVEATLAAADEAGASIYFVHISTAEALEAITRARSDGRRRVHLETCPQYLFLDDMAYAGSDGAQFVVAPPLRPAPHSEALRRALRDGRIDVVATDHCPFRREQKGPAGAPFTALPGGLPGVETRLSLLYTEMVVPGLISMEDLVRVTSAGPARIFGLYPRKGTLVPGSDADLVLFDPRADGVLSAGNLHMRTDFSPFEGRRIRGRVVSVIRRGQVVVQDGALVAARPGAYLAR
jgi:dihydropyrimidinase